MISITKVLVLISISIGMSNGQLQQGPGGLNQTIYDFLRTTQAASKFYDLFNRAAQAANDPSVVNALGGSASNKILPTDNSGMGNGYTVFVPVNDALNQLPQNAEVLRNDFNNFVIKGLITLDMIKQNKDGRNITSSQTFGFMPRLSLRMVANFYSRQLDETVSISTRRRKRQAPFQNQNDLTGNNSDSNLYEQYEAMYGKKPNYEGPPISPKLPQDELYLLNSAIILDKFDLSNGIVYLIDSYPQYYDKSLYVLSKENGVSGLGQNINFWVNKADELYNAGRENLKNALNAYGPNTFFLPADPAFNKITNRDLITNDSYLVDVILKSHRLSNQLLFDYYLDDAKVNYKTDGGMSVSTKHRYVNKQLQIEVSIGHVKGLINPQYRNIYCASGIIHLIDTVLGVPTDSAYKRISAEPTLSSFRQLIDASPTYKQIFDVSPVSLGSPNAVGTQQTSTIKQYTFLVPNDFGLLAIKDDLLKNLTALEDFLSTHIITDSSNKIFFTDHDDSVFTSGRQYTTMNQMQSLTTAVKLSSDGVSNSVVFSMASSPSVKSMIVDGNDLVSNGVIHVIDKPLSLYTTDDITALLDKYATINSPGQPAFSQFVDALRSTGIFNDLKEPSKQYTLFIPTNEALAQYQDIMKGNDQEKKKQLIYRHICIDQNLQSKNLASNSTGSASNQPQEGQLICRNALGQDLTLSKDKYGLISNWQGMASSKIINDFPGSHASAYLLDTPLLNTNLPNLGLHAINAAGFLEPTLSLLLAVFSFIFLF